METERSKFPKQNRLIFFYINQNIPFYKLFTFSSFFNGHFQYIYQLYGIRSIAKINREFCLLNCFQTSSVQSRSFFHSVWVFVYPTKFPNFNQNFFYLINNTNQNKKKRLFMSELSNKNDDNSILSPSKTNIDVRHCVKPEKKVRRMILVIKNNQNACL